MDTTRTYLRVIQGVLARSKSEFAAEQISDRALNKLSTLWESKLLTHVNEERDEGFSTTVKLRVVNASAIRLILMK
jgi:hypothetical protein